MHINEHKLPAFNIYNSQILQVYDFWVLGMTNLFFWKCPTRVITEKFEISLSKNHIDVGVGSGYFLDHCLKKDTCRIGLVDANKTCLSATSKRIKRFRPETYVADIRDPLNVETEQFDSMSLNFVLHGLPGTMDEKSVVLGNVLKLLRPGGKLFGSTVLCDSSLDTGVAAKTLMKIYNKFGIYSNQSDTLNELKKVLNEHLDYIEIDIVGCVAVFSGSKKSTSLEMDNIRFPVSPFLFSEQ
ncbi:class I SAM-dependent methyltransferase [Veronia pacifica]|uniref:Methyltransferase type 12 domain-containing protein n=1 Tax=Veronia pacifica TaxID=1080227 RepID=A0A1C3EG22_9GAMM|nr:class I SAM-dependent methyltransferase [Veronia pacifica]ODA32169.1 hypothetical protein A8L45_13990 [Veronia pacifica]